MADIQRRVTQLSTSSAIHGVGDNVTKPTEQIAKSPPSNPRSAPNHLRKHKNTDHQYQRLPVNPDRLSFKRPSAPAPSVKRVKITDRRSPWERYHRFMKLDQGGPAIIAHSDFALVAIKERKAKDEDQVDCIISITSSYVVNLERAFFDNGTIYLVYECMDIALRNIRSCPKGDLTACEIAAVCKEVLNGLAYIHKELQLYHGDLHCGNILVSKDGRIKIGNVGDSMIEERVICKEMARKDIRALGLVMVELMEPETSTLNPDSITLQRPEKWPKNIGIQEFLAATETSSLDDLKTNIFLPTKPVPQCLNPYVLMAQVSARAAWEIFP